MNRLPLEVYESYYKKFTLYNPSIAETVEKWEPYGRHSVRLYLTDGSVWIYHEVMNAVRKVVAIDYTEKSTAAYRRCLMDFRTRLVELMSEHGYSQKELGELTGISQGSISNYLNMKTLPNIYDARRLAAVFGCSIDDLLY